MPRRLVLVFLAYMLAVHCAENRLHTYMMVQAKTNKKKGEIELSTAPQRLMMLVPDGEELEELAENLRLASASKYYRLPPLTYVKFEFENLSGSPWRLNFRDSYFETTVGTKFKVVDSKEYSLRFTSVVYDYFRYDAMYAGYITKREGQLPKESFWYEKKLLNEDLLVKPKESGFQIVPVDFLPAGIEDLTFYFPVGEGRLNSVKIQLVTERGS